VCRIGAAVAFCCSCGFVWIAFTVELVLMREPYSNGYDGSLMTGLCLSMWFEDLLTYL
jgi:hypothetical protein